MSVLRDTGTVTGEEHHDDGMNFVQGYKVDCENVCQRCAEDNVPALPTSYASGSISFKGTSELTSEASS
jgi:hypothetical protein